MTNQIACLEVGAFARTLVTPLGTTFGTALACLKKVEPFVAEVWRWRLFIWNVLDLFGSDGDTGQSQPCCRRAVCTPLRQYPTAVPVPLPWRIVLPLSE